MLGAARSELMLEKSSSTLAVLRRRGRRIKIDDCMDVRSGLLFFLVYDCLGF
ncbi:hypothetical protein RMSM_03471 [Rhodopirellula maiorica SM1]|uniref:Uncharacterized protein n=1 Tax=Rhodopirellula maiorica SM1 TaxID=1265738 RepID=M5RJX0_9BACT|nr:hypothetical protein RMSM_03471 [Rhodopirellula maiorica SM1]